MDLEQRKARMKAAGIPMPITQVPISEGAAGAIPVTQKNADLHSRLQALKSGANKQAVQDIVNSKGRQQFQAIPEPKRNNHPNQQVASDKKVSVQSNFGPKASTSGEFAMMDALYGGDGGGYSQPTMNLNPGAANMANSQPELSIQQDGYGPSFDPRQALAEKNRRAQESGGYMQYAANAEQHALEMQQQEMGNNQQVQFNFDNMKRMMEQIAKSTISDVLSEYTEKQKGKLVFENYGKSKDGNQIVKTPEGNYFKMIPVKIKS